MITDRVDVLSKSLRSARSRRAALRTTAAGLAASLVGASGLRAAAQRATPVATDAPALVGSWIVDVQFDGSQPLSLPNLVTYTADRTVLVAAPPRLPELPNAGPQQDFFSAGHGVWSEADGGADLRFAFLVSDENGNLASINTIQATVTLDATGDAYNGTFSLEIADATGSVTGSSTGTLHGTRIVPAVSGPISLPGH